MKELFDQISLESSIIITKRYSTSFSLGIKLLKPEIRAAIYSIYGFVRLADEIVDTFHDYDKKELFTRFKEDTYRALDEKISLNPVLNAFQTIVHKYDVSRVHIDAFLDSMEMDLRQVIYHQNNYEQYIVGSAEVVGLMCLKVFCLGNQEEYDTLEFSAKRLGAAFQKINFLRDLKDDYQTLGRMYFPGIDMTNFNEESKKDIEMDIDKDFQNGLTGIKQLPKNARLGVYVAFTYYYALYQKIKRLPSSEILTRRVRVSNKRKVALLCSSFLRYKLNRL
ncbi:MAG: phytoene synthase [Flavobacteriales bacterium]|jgi:phytoene synthase